VLRGLRRRFPAARLSWLVATTCAPLIADDTDLDAVILFDRPRLGRAWRSAGALRDLTGLLAALARARFDWVIDLQGLLRSGLLTAATGARLRAGFADAREGATVFYTHRVRAAAAHTVDRNLALARALGVDARADDLTLQVGPRPREFAQRLRRERLGDAEFLVCVPPTRWATKRYPVRHWRTVAAAMARRLPVVLLGSPGERELCRQVADGLGPDVHDLSGQTGVAEMVAVIAAAAGVICSDSAAKFIAPAVGTDSVTLIGPTRPERTGPYRLGRALVAPVPCRGCLKKTCPHGSCMDLIAPDAVIAAAEDLLARRSRSCR